MFKDAKRIKRMEGLREGRRGSTGFKYNEAGYCNVV